MQAVLLAAGRGSRMKELTESRPKPMLEVHGKPLLAHKFDQFPDEVDEVVIVVGYFGHVVQQYFGGEYRGRRVFYVEQENPTGGTAEALFKAQSLLKDRFFVMNGDNLYAREDMRACLAHEWAVVVQEREHVATGRVVVDKGGRVVDIAENSVHEKKAGLANTGLYLLDMRIFEYPPVPKAPGSSELGLPQTMIQAAKNVRIDAVNATFWFEIKSPEDLKKAEALLAL